MEIGDDVTYRGRKLVLLGHDPMSVPDRYAQVTVQQDGTEIEVDSRPSDAIALAIRAEAPIFAADRVIEESAIEFEGEDVDQDQLEAEVAKFKHFLDEVTPEDFAVENGEEES